MKLRVLVVGWQATRQQTVATTSNATKNVIFLFIVSPTEKSVVLPVFAKKCRRGSKLQTQKAMFATVALRILEQTCHHVCKKSNGTRALQPIGLKGNFASANFYNYIVPQPSQDVNCCQQTRAPRPPIGKKAICAFPTAVSVAQVATTFCKVQNSL